MKQLESTIERKVTRWAERNGLEYCKLKKAGRPDDIFFIGGGRPVLIEFKRLRKDLERLQAYIAKKLRRAGYDVVRCDDAEVGIAYLKKRMKETDHGRRKKVSAPA